MPVRPLTPSPNRIVPPPFYELEEEQFEELCCSLFDAQEGVLSCDRYRRSGHRQFGIDLLAVLKEPGATSVGQCKCLTKIKPADIKGASDEFLKYWDTHWRTRNVRRFILFAASDLSDAKNTDQLDEERKRFAKLGITYEPWSPRILAEKLAPHWQIVVRHMASPEVWVPRICGHPLPPHMFPTSSTGTAIASGSSPETMLGSLLRSSLQGLTAQVQELRALARRGQSKAAMARLTELQSNQVLWSMMEPGQRAEILRLKASLVLRDTDGLVEAETLAAQADLENPGGTDALRLRTTLILEKEGPEAALRSLGPGADLPEEVEQVRIVALLRLERAPEAAEIARLLPKRSGETERLFAIALLASGRAEEAQISARKAVAEAPDLWLARMTLGIVLYYGALSPAAIPPVPGTAWPDPPAWPLVRRDDASLAKFREAYIEFGRVAASHPDHASPNLIEHWQLACLANDPERRQEAARLCRKLLEEDRTDPAAIAWALARAIRFNKQQSRDAIQVLLEKGRGDASSVVAAAAIDLAGNHGRRAVKLLRAYRSLFDKESALGSYDLLLAQAEISAGSTIETMSSPATDGAIAFLAVTPETGAVDPAALSATAGRLLTAGWNASGGNAAGAMACLGQLAHIGRWDLVLEHVQTLVDRIGTADAIRLAAYALGNTKRAKDALELLDRNQGLFPGNRLPHDLLGLRRDCLAELGSWVDAVALGDDLARTSGSSLDWLSLAELHLRAGNARKAAEAVRVVAERGPLPPPEAVRYATLLSLDDPELARRLLRSIDVQKLAGEHIGIALETAHRLGLEHESKPIVARMVSLAAEGATEAIRLVSFEEVQKVSDTVQSTLHNLDSMYSAARAPIHLAEGVANVNLAKIYHAALEEREKGWDRAPGVLLARFGGRDWPEPDQYPTHASEIRLHVDVTGLLLAHHLGLLDAVERCFRPLRVSQRLVPALLTMRRNAVPNSPGQVEALRRLVDLVERKQIRVACTPGLSGGPHSPGETSPEAKWLAREAADSGGVVVDWHDPDASVDGDLASKFTNCSGLIAALVRAGALDAAEEQRSRDYLGTAGEEAAREIQLVPGTSIFFHANTVDGLVSSGALEAAARMFPIFVESGHVEEAKREIVEADSGTKLAAWVGGLIERVNVGLHDGTYEPLPLATAQDELASDRPVDNLLGGLRDLLAIPYQPGDVVWFEDRYMSQYTTAGQTPIVGCPEILGALLLYGRLSKDEYFSSLLRLRAGRVMFVSPAPDEIAHHLLAAKVDGHGVASNRAVDTLRHYLGASLVREETLVQPDFSPVQSNPGGEVWFLSRWQSETSSALIAVWNDPNGSDEERAARATYILESLSVEQHRTVPVLGRPASHRTLAGVRLGMMVAKAAFLVDKKARLAAYFGWLNAFLLKPRLDADPDISKSLLQSLGGALKEIAATIGSDDELQLGRLVVGRLVNALPDPLRTFAFQDNDFLETIGLRPVIRTFELMGTTFNVEIFWLAAARAIESGSAEVPDQAGLKFRIDYKGPGHDGLPLLSVEGPDHSRVQISDPIAAFLVRNSSKWLEAIRGQRGWFDARTSEFDQQIQHLGSMEDPAKRLEALLATRETSSAWHYLWLGERIRNSDPLTAEDMRPPSASSLIRHLRMDSEVHKPLSARLERAARILVDEEGLDEAFLRLGGLPVPLAKPLVDAVSQLTPDQLHSFRERWANSPSPMMRLHAIRASAAAMGRAGAPDPADLTTDVDEMIRDAEEGGWFGALLSVLAAVDGWFASWNETASLSDADQLMSTWSHANRILLSFAETGAPPDWVVGAFKNLEPIGAHRYFQTSQRLGEDAAYPRGVSRRRLLLLGLYYALGRNLATVLDQKQIMRLRSICIAGGETGLPVAEFLTKATPGRDTLGSFLSADLHACFSDIFGPEAAKSVSAEALEALADSALDLASTDEEHASQAWLILRWVLGNGEPFPSLTPKLDACILRAQNYFPEDSDSQVSLLALQFVCTRAAKAQNAEVSAAVESHLLRVAAEMHRQRTEVSREGKTDSHCLALLQGAFWLAQRPTPQESTKVLADLITKLVQALPGLAEPARRLVFGLCRNLPLTVAEPIWPVLNVLRCYP